MKNLLKKQIMIPIMALIILAVFNLIVDPSFFKITMGYNSMGNPVLSGYLITILDYSGSVVLRVLCGTNSRPDTLQAPIIVAFLVSCIVAMLFGAFNGVLVSYFKIQPMVATLILYTAGRSIAAWINNNELPIVNDATFTYFGGFIPGIPIPTPFFIMIACLIVMALAMKFTNLKLYVFKSEDGKAAYFCNSWIMCCGFRFYQSKPSVNY